MHKENLSSSLLKFETKPACALLSYKRFRLISDQNKNEELNITLLTISSETYT